MVKKVFDHLYSVDVILQNLNQQIVLESEPYQFCKEITIS
jgi:hypothetical protein